LSLASLSVPSMSSLSRATRRARVAASRSAPSGLWQMTNRSSSHAMNQPIGDVRLKAARQHAGFTSQQALADALNRAASQLGLGHTMISSRQVRRWEAAAPPWPRADHQKLLVHVLHLPIDQLGFTPPWDVPSSGSAAAAAAAHDQAASRRGSAVPVLTSGGMIQPPTVASDYAIITAAHRRLYASVQPSHLHAAVVEHTAMGAHLLPETTGVSRQVLAAALAESLLLAGRIEFFDLRGRTTLSGLSSKRYRRRVKRTTRCSAPRFSHMLPLSQGGKRARTIRRPYARCQSLRPPRHRIR